MAEPRSFGAPIGGGQLTKEQREERERERAAMLARQPTMEEMARGIREATEVEGRRDRRRNSRDLEEENSRPARRSIQGVAQGDPTGGMRGRNAQAIRRELGIGSARDTSRRGRDDNGG